MISAAAALAQLREGNQRFVQDQSETANASHRVRRAELVGGQQPFAIVLGCSDSRVPAELVFDQGFGDLFVIRVAGNIVAPSQVGSVEFAASRYGTRSGGGHGPLAVRSGRRDARGAAGWRDGGVEATCAPSWIGFALRWRRCWPAGRPSIPRR